VRRSRALAAALFALAIGAAALPLGAAAFPVGRAAPPHVAGAANGLPSAFLNERLQATGVYRVRVAVSTHSASGNVVSLEVGSVARQVKTAGRDRRATVTVQLAVPRHTLVIRATARQVAPNLAVTVSRIRPLGAASGTTASPQTHAKPKSGAGVTRAAGPTGSTGSTASSGSVESLLSGSSGSSGAGGSSGSSGSTGSSGLSGSSAPASPAAPTTDASGPIGDPGSWHSIFDDEFNANTLDTTNWSTGWLGNSITGPMNTEELECYDPAQAIEANGELDLNLIAQPTQNCQLAGGPTTVNEPYDSAMITTRNKFNYTYGFLETRIWLPGATTGVDWPGIWAVGNNWPTDGELDLVEGLGGQACWHFHDPSGAPGGCSNATYTGGWHTFGADWEPGNVTWYYDGTPIGTTTTAITTAPMYLIADLAIDNTYGGPTQAPATLRIDYIRIWQH
jgi:beta-glucanase (GH16 family)